MALVENESSRFEDRKIRLLVSDQPSLWTEGLGGKILRMPVAHGEGRPLLAENSPVEGLNVIFRYCDRAGQPTVEYPDNPNGAGGSVAGISDGSGMVMGLMPHPERASLAVHYSQDGLEIFRNLVRWLDKA